MVGTSPEQRFIIRNWLQPVEVEKCRQRRTMCSLDGLALAARHLAPEVFALKGGSGVIRRPEPCSELEPITGEVGVSTHAAGCAGDLTGC